MTIFSDDVKEREQAERRLLSQKGGAKKRQSAASFEGPLGCQAKEECFSLLAEVFQRTSKQARKDAEDEEMSRADESLLLPRHHRVCHQAFRQMGVCAFDSAVIL